MHNQEPCVCVHTLYLLPLLCALPLNYRAELSKPPLPKIISCFRGWKMWQLIFICRMMQWVSESSWGWGGGWGQAALKWQLGNMRGRTEGREQMKNGRGRKEGRRQQTASPGHERVVPCGAVLFPLSFYCSCSVIELEKYLCCYWQQLPSLIYQITGERERSASNKTAWCFFRLLFPSSSCPIFLTYPNLKKKLLHPGSSIADWNTKWKTELVIKTSVYGFYCALPV